MLESLVIKGGTACRYASPQRGKAQIVNQAVISTEGSASRRLAKRARSIACSKASPKRLASRARGSKVYDNSHPGHERRQLIVARGRRLQKNQYRKFNIAASISPGDVMR